MIKVEKVIMNYPNPNTAIMIIIWCWLKVHDFTILSSFYLKHASEIFYKLDRNHMI